MFHYINKKYKRKLIRAKSKEEKRMNLYSIKTSNGKIGRTAFFLKIIYMLIYIIYSYICVE